MKAFTLSLRNILRNRRRSIITMLAILVGAFTILLFGGYSNAVNHGVETGFVRQMGHLQIQRKGYFLYGSGSPESYGIYNYEDVIAKVKNDPVLAPLLKVVTPVLYFFGIAGNFDEGVSRTIAGVGVIPAQQNELRHWNAYAFPGLARPIALPDGDPTAAVIGQGVARVLKLCQPLKVPYCSDPPVRTPETGAPAPADVVALADQEHRALPDVRPAGPDPRLEVLAAMARGVPNVISVNVKAAENQGIKEMDDTFIALPLEQAQKLVYGHGQPGVTAIILQLKNTGQIPTAKERLQALFGGGDYDLEFMSFASLNPTYDQIRGLFGSIFGFISLLMGTIVLFSVANTMSMAVVERTVEVGTLRALGVRRSGVSQMFLLEGLLIGAIGTALGVLVALGLAALVNSTGLSWTPPGQVDPIPLVIHLANDDTLIAGTWIGLTLIAALSAVLPALKAARLPVVDALRHI